MSGSDRLTSLDQIVAASDDASLDDFLSHLDAVLELDVHVGMEESDGQPGLVIKIAPMYESLSPYPAWIRTKSVPYPTTLAEIYEIVRGLDAAQVREWEERDDDEDFGVDPGAPALEPGDRLGTRGLQAFFGLSPLDSAVAAAALRDPTAAALHLIRTLGISPGGAPGAAHYGATTLLVRHVKVLKNAARLVFTAHHGAQIDLRTDDPLTRQIARVYTTGKRPSERLFDTTPKKVNAYLQRFIPGCTAKDLRTVLCCTLAKTEIAQIDEQWEYPRSPEQLQLYMREVAEFVAAKVGNTWRAHLSATIDPGLFDHWRAAAGRCGQAPTGRR